jgi:iron complex outermembrane recepter protein
MKIMKRIKRINLSLVLAAGLTLGCVPYVFAQETSTNEFSLEEITVTAERRTADVQKSAISITALTGDLLETKQSNTLDDALKQAPAIQIQGLVHGASIFIRGIGNTEGTPAVSTNVDGVYQSSNDNVTQSVYDIERIEVLRGPSGTMYGRNSTGGAVNIITGSPHSKFEASGSVQIGNYKEARTEGMVNVPVTDALSLRAAFETERHDGYLTNGNMNADSQAVRFKAGYQPNEDLKFVATFEYKFDGAAPGTVGAPLSSRSNPWYAGDISEWLQNIYEQRSYSYSINLDWNLKWGTLTFIPSYSINSNYEATKLIGMANAQAGKNAQYTGELRIASPADSTMTWVGGLFYLKPKSFTMPSSIFDRITDAWETGGPGGGVDTTANYDVYNYIGGSAPYQIAAFAQATYPVTDRFRLTGGLRYTKDFATNKYYITIPAQSYVGPTVSQNAGNTKLMYKVGVEYDVSKKSMLYAAISSGYNAGGYNQSTTLGPTQYKPEELMSYTVGAKNRFINDRLQINAEAFYYDYKNQQVQYSPTFNVITQRSERMMTNVGSSTMKGGELENTLVITKEDRLTLNISYLDAMYDKFSYTDYGWGPVGTSYNYDNTPMPNSPKWSGTLEYEHSFNLSNGGQISVDGSVKYSQKYYTTFEKGFTDSIQPSYHKSDAYLAYFSADGKWNARLYCKNIENMAQRMYAMPNFRIMIMAPRTFGARFAAKF